MPASIVPYLSFNGNTREAFAFYEKALGATVQAMMTYDQMPKPDTAAAPIEGCGNGAAPTGDGIMHAAISLPGGAMLFAGDVPPGMPFDGIKGVMLALSYDTADEADRVFAALSEGGRVTMPLAPSFWARTFGMLTDRYGVSWAVNGEPVPMP